VRVAGQPGFGGANVTMPTERLILHRGLGFEARREFIAAARAAMEMSDQDVELDCSTVDVAEAIDDPVNRPGFGGGSGYWIPTRVWSACWAA
jgi:hypothetical protein